MPIERLRCWLVLILLLSLTPGIAAQGTFPTNEDLRHFRAINDPRLSPDGHQVLYRITDATADGGPSHLWVTDIGSDKFRQLTFAPAGAKPGQYRGENNGNWMPDGSSILFLAKRGEHTQLYRLPMQGGEAQAFELKVVPLVTAAPDAIQTGKSPAKPEENAEAQPIDVSSYAISPDGKFVAILAEDPESPGERKQKEDKADAAWVDHDVHGTRLFLLDPQTEKLTRAAVGPDVRIAAWSPDSTRLLAITEAPNNQSDLGPTAKAFLVSANDVEHPTEVKELPPTIEEAAWSHDGRSIYFHAQAAKDTPPGYVDLYELELAGKSVRNLTPDFSGSVEHESPIGLASGGVLEAVANGVRTGAIQISGGAAVTLEFATPLAGSFNTNETQSGWVFFGAGARQPRSLYFTASLDQSARQLDIPSLVPKNARAVEPKIIHWKSDQFIIEGLLYLPPEAGKQHVPLIVDVHGGPTGAWQDGYDPFVNYLIGRGWAVLRANVRGSTNYGVTIVAADKNDLGGGDYRDLMAGVDYVLKNYPIDPDRLGLYGYSYGGEMAGFVEGKTTRFKAIVSGAPVIDQYSEYGTEDGSWYDRWFFGKPWEHVTDAWRQSPLSGSAQASTPFLLLQGEADKTDPLGQSQEMYRALRQMGVPVELVTYPREDHGPLARGIVGQPVAEPWHGFDARKRIVEFFQKAFHAAH